MSTDRATRLQHTLVARLKLRHLVLLQKIERHGTLSRVADEMQLSQPAITKALREVEDIFMAQLFRRTSRGLQATPAGQAALHYAHVTLADMESAAQVLTAIDTGMSGRFRMGLTPQVPEAIRNAAFTHLLGQSPRVAVLAREGTTDELVAALAARELDCAIGRSYQDAGLEIVQEPIYEQEPCLLVSVKSRSRLSRGPLDWARLAELDWIFPPPNTPMRRTFNALFLSAGVQPPPPIMETISIRAIETVLRLEPNSVTILAHDVAADMTLRGSCAALPYRLSWSLPPVSLFMARSLASHPMMQSLAQAIRQAAARLNAPVDTGRITDLHGPWEA